MKKRIIKGCAWALALLTAVSFLAVRPDVAYGATAVDGTRTPRSLTLDLAKNAGETYAELTDIAIPVRYYKVAEMNIPTGTYTNSLKAPWDGLKNVEYKVVKKADGEGYDVKVKDVDKDYESAVGDPVTASLENITLDTTEEGRKNATYAWEALAKKAKDISEKEKITESGAAAVSGGTAVIDLKNDSLGMYLILADDVDSENYTYSFKPYLISIPTNGYADGVSGSSDEWLYEVTMGLKPEQEERCGMLRITKTLSDFNDSLGARTSFIFEVKAEKDGKIVYSDVVQIEFTGAGTQSVTIGPEAGEGVDVIGRIPAGAQVTVTEVYGGASYTATDGTVKTTTMQAYETEGDVAEVSFTNQYNGGVNGGSSVVNHFAYTESENGNGGNWQYVPSRPAEGGNAQ